MLGRLLKEIPRLTDAVARADELPAVQDTNPTNPSGTKAH
jgi:hypothetical protein